MRARVDARRDARSRRGRIAIPSRPRRNTKTRGSDDADGVAPQKTTRATRRDASGMDERAALLSRAVADAEERTRAETRGRARARGKDGKVSTSRSSDDDDAVLERSAGRGRRTRAMMVTIGLACAVGLAALGARTRGGDGGLLGGRGASDGAATKRGERGRSSRAKTSTGGARASVDLTAETESREVSRVAGVEDFTASDSRLAGYSKLEVADAIKHAVEFVKKEQLEEKRLEAKTSSDVGGLGSDEIPDEDTWGTPMHLMARPGAAKDRDALKVTLSKLLTTHDVELVSKNVKITASVNPKKWPDGLDRAVYALKSVFEILGGDYLHPDFSLLKGLDWIEAPNSRDLDGKIAGAWGALSNHVGTLFGHMYQWQLAKDSMNKATIIVDSDGLAPTKLGVPVSSFGAIIDNAPAEYDIILLNTYPDVENSHTVAEFPDHRGHDLKLTTWKSPGHTGLSTYIISSSFPDRVFAYAAQKGAGYLDSWIVDDLCTRKVCDDDGEIVGMGAITASQPLLRCYRAHGVIETHHDKQSDQATTVIAENVEANTTTVPATGKLVGDHKHATKEDDKPGKAKGVSDDSLKKVMDETLDEDSERRASQKKSSHHENDSDHSSKESSNKDSDADAKKSKHAHVHEAAALEASLGVTPFARESHATKPTGLTSDFIFDSMHELNAEHGSLIHKKFSLLHKHQHERERVEAMIKRLHDLRASGKEATAQDILSAVPTEEEPIAEPIVEPIAVVPQSVVEPARKEEFEAKKPAPKADAEVGNFLTGL